jgi:hypothetical protein
MKDRELFESGYDPGVHTEGEDRVFLEGRLGLPLVTLGVLHGVRMSFAWTVTHLTS